MNLTVGMVSTSFVELNWISGHSYGGQQTFVIEYRNSGSSGWTVVANVPGGRLGGQTYSKIISSLQPGTAYIFRVYATNRFGNSYYTDNVQIVTRGNYIKLAQYLSKSH